MATIEGMFTALQTTEFAEMVTTDKFFHEEFNSTASNINQTLLSSDNDVPTEGYLSSFTEVKIAKFLDLYIEGFIIFGGMLSNLLIWVVYRYNKYGDLSVYTYIRALALDDFLLVSINLMTHWINYNFSTDSKNIHLCRAILFLARVFFDFNAWVMVSISIDRWLAIRYPIHARKLWCTPIQAKKIISVISLLSVLKNMYTFWVAGFAVSYTKTTQICTLLYSKNKLIDRIFPWIDLTIGSILPFVLITVFNVMTAIEVKVAHHTLISEQNSEGNHTAIMNEPETKEMKKRKDIEKQVTTMMILVCTFFVVLTLPRQIFILTWSNLRPARTMQNMAIFTLIHSITQKMWYVNSFVNFSLYCCTGTQFRNELLQLFCVRNRNLQASDQENSASTARTPVSAPSIDNA